MSKISGLENHRYLDIFKKKISRNKFIKYALGFVGLASIASVSSCAPSPPEGVKLNILSGQEYANAQAIAEITLEKAPIPFDLGLAFDELLSQNTFPAEKIPVVLELLSVPSSILATLVLDFSLTPMIKLDIPQRKARLESYRSSDNELKIAISNMYQQIPHYLITKSQEYSVFVGYDQSKSLKPYSRIR